MFDFLRKWRAAPKAPATALRRFDGARIDRLTAGWRATNAAIDSELRSDLDLLRARSRDLAKNNEYVAKFLRMVRNNVAGPDGFTLQCRAADYSAANPNGVPDTGAIKAIEGAWWRWSRQCDVTGRMTWPDMVRTMVTALARDGELLLRKVRGGGEFGFQLRLLDIERLDTKFNREASGNANAIVMGVEQDADQRPVAYHLWTTPTAASGSLTRTRERVPASEIIHRFMPLEIEQSRGVPWIHAAMRRLNDLNGYRDAAVIAARIGASKMGFFTSPEGTPPAADGKDEQGNFVQTATPGEFGVLPTGYDFKTFDPSYPHDQFDAFCKAALRGIAGAIGVAYNGLANDLEGVNFSSIRAGVLEERDEWLVVQSWITDAVLVPVYEEWLEMALLRGAIRLANGSALPAAKLEKFREHGWQGRRWQWVDPLKDIQAVVFAIRNRLASPQQVAAQTGRDVEDVLDDIQRFEAMLKERGLTILDASIASDPPPAAPAN